MDLPVALRISPETSPWLQYVEARKGQVMDRDSQELRAYSHSWPPGFFTGSVMLDTETRSRRRDGLTVVCLAVCAYSLGFGLTDWACDSSEKAASTIRAEAEAVALHRSRITASPTGARPETLAPETPAPETLAPETLANQRIVPEPVHVAEMAKPAPVVAHANPLPVAPKRAKPVRPVQPARTAPAAVAETAADRNDNLSEPTPVFSPEEVNQALALAEASQRIFASVDEVAPKPVVVVPPPAAIVRRTEAPRAATVVTVEALSVDGALTSRAVNRGVQRLLPQYDRCREYSDSAPQRLKLSTTIDEAGRGRRVTVEGESRPSLRHCLEQATTHLVVPAPDTGTARAHWVVRFAAR